MKRTLFYGNGGKIIAGMLALILIVSGVYFPRTDANKVMAADSTDSTTPTGFVAESMSVTEDAPTKEGYWFAGWYTAATCKKEEAITTKVVGQQAYAKFVPTEVLSVKAQTSETVHEADDEFDYQYKNLRLLTTVESLNFNKVGFRVYFDGGEGVDLPIDTVYSRITAGNGGVAYKYSAKVVDTKSEYFATTTLTGINAETELDKVFRIEPYWVTFDGTTVYGVTRYLTVNDADNGIINIPVKVDSTTDVNDLTVTYGTSNTSATVKTRYTNGATDAQYVNLAVTVEGTLPSATKFTVSDGSGTTVTEVIHRNLTTEYLPSNTNGNYSADTTDDTWYSVYGDADEYIIATTADFYALPNLVNEQGVTFEGKKIYLVSDIIANTGSATASSFTAESGSAYKWVPIGSIANEDDAAKIISSFKGEFDGCGHTISGLYVNSNYLYTGMFGCVVNAKIKNFRLTNSFLKSTATDAKTASIGGVVSYAYDECTVENVYNSTYLHTKHYVAGGIVGKINRVSDSSTVKVNISNCWYNGIITSHNSITNSSNVRHGGILGYSLFGTNLIENCLFTGKIATVTGQKFGGIVADSNPASYTTITVRNSMSAGSITSTDNTSVVGSIAGRSNAGAVILDNVYATEECFSSTIGTGSYSTIEGSDAAPNVVSQIGITGMGAYYFTELDFNNAWSLQEGTLPIPKTLATAEQIKNEMASTGIAEVDTSWYDEGSTDTETNITTYTISDAADLYGLAFLVNNNKDNFDDDIIQMSDHIDLNPDWEGGLSIVDGTPNAADAPKDMWVPIGTTSNPFKGTFDGNEKTISGLYISKKVITGESTGLFGATDDCIIRNLGLKDGYLHVKTINDNYQTTGTVIGFGDGRLENVYSNVGLYGVRSKSIGGLVGKVGPYNYEGEKVELNLDTCCYEGTIALRTDDMSEQVVGGLIGYALLATVNIDHVLFNGNINYKTSKNFSEDVSLKIGGFIGRDVEATTTNLSDSVISGSISVEKADEEIQYCKNIASVKGYGSGTLQINEAVYTTLTDWPQSVEEASDIVEEMETTWSQLYDLNQVYWTLSTSIPVLSGLASYAGWECP